MGDFFIIDGYNIINNWECLKDISKEDLEFARQRLLDLLMEYKVYKDGIIIVVFDAHQVRGNIGKKFLINGIEVVFTKEGETADEYIEKLVYNLKKTDKKVFVITSDWLEQRTIMMLGAVRIPVSEFISDINLMKNEQKRKMPGVKAKDNIIWDNISPETLDRLQRLRRGK